MKLKHVLPFFIIIVLMSSTVSAGFFGNILSIITGKAIGKEGFYIEYESNFDLSGSSTCTGQENLFALRSYGEDLIKIADNGAETKEIYITKGGCKGIYYLDRDTGKVVSLKAQAANLIILNRYYYLVIKGDADMSELLGAGYRVVVTAEISSDDKTMKMESGTSKTKLIYPYNEGSKKFIIYEASDGILMKADSVSEKIEFDSSPTLVAKKEETPAAAPKTEDKKETEPVAAGKWNEERVSAIESQLSALSEKVDVVAGSVEQICGQEEEKGFWAKLFRG